ncbi:MAG: ABC transporter ATP-binding protein, partial [Clostridia bacterium]|nr:ABC transporter ATP-binding protein [Clostridia bacterium]
MNNKEVKLSVNNLRISFRTDAGKVQAVRDISFDLYKGETLAIVGESGSGKSVTSKAIMGISAVNSISENGEILYDGQDLLRIPEEEMHKLRGDKIAMIFQDPLSSLNPIMRIGKQITEAMLLKNKANRKEGRVTFNSTLATMSSIMKTALAEQSAPRYTPEDVDAYIKAFDEFNILAIKLEDSYNAAHTAAEELIAIAEDFIFLAEKNQKVDAVATLKLAESKLKDVAADRYFSSKFTDRLSTLFLDLKTAKHTEKAKVSVLDTVKKIVTMSTVRTEASEEAVGVLSEAQRVAKEMLEQPEYNFFRIGYYVSKHPEADLSTMPADEANAMAYEFLQNDFMNEFIALEKIAVQYSNERTIRNKRQALDDLKGAVQFFKSGSFAAPEAYEMYKNVNKSVLSAIDPLAVIKDNIA